MRTRVVLLGTAGGPTPKANRSAPAQAVVVDDRLFVVDCGNGVAHQLARAGIAPRQLEAVFLTHHHSDHNVDLSSLLVLSWAAGLDHGVQLFGPPPLCDHLDHAFAAHRFDIETRIEDEGRRDLGELWQATDVTTPQTLYERDGVRVRAVLVNHPPIRVALGFRIDTPDRSVVFSGDTTPCGALTELAQGADTLVHEVMHVPSLERLSRRVNAPRLLRHLLGSHTPSTEVGRVAEAAGVPTLVLTHLVPGDDSVPEETWLADARQGYRGTVILGRDLQEI